MYFCYIYIIYNEEIERRSKIACFRTLLQTQYSNKITNKLKKMLLTQTEKFRVVKKKNGFTTFKMIRIYKRIIE